jgi:hypothetical protein
VKSRNLSRRVDQIERRATPARKWMIGIARQPGLENSKGPILTLVLPRVSDSQPPRSEDSLRSISEPIR